MWRLQPLKTWAFWGVAEVEKGSGGLSPRAMGGTSSADDSKCRGCGHIVFQYRIEGFKLLDAALTTIDIAVSVLGSCRLAERQHNTSHKTKCSKSLLESWEFRSRQISLDRAAVRHPSGSCRESLPWRRSSRRRRHCCGAARAEVR